LLTASRYLLALILFICAALLGVALLQTLKGSGMIALAGGIGTIALLYAPRLSPRLLALGAIILIVALVLAAPFYDDLAQRAVFLIQRETGALFATGRTAIWAQLLAYLPQRPLFGFGLNNTSLLVAPLPSLNAGTFVFNIPTAESAYVAALIETGIIGFAALLLFIGVVFVRAYRNARSARAIGIAAATVAIFCGSLTVVGLTTDQNGMLLGALIGLIFSSPNSQWPI
jgi:O-antigen ligase